MGKNSKKPTNEPTAHQQSVSCALNGHENAKIMKYDSQKILGRGGFALVFLGTFDGENVAVKRIQLPDLNVAFSCREEDAMKQLDHPHILRLLHVEANDTFKFLVLELCIASVFDYIKGTYKDKMPSELDALKQMANGLDYIHSRGLVHRDIKPENVLISQEFTLKISDFGFSRSVSNTGSFAANSGPTGTQIYFSPEFLLLENKPEVEWAKVRANVSIDIFSLGCLFFSYIKKGGPRTHLFVTPGKENELLAVYTSDITTNIREGTKFLKEGLPSEHYASKMIDGMTRSDSNERWKLKEVLETLNNQHSNNVDVK